MNIFINGKKQEFDEPLNITDMLKNIEVTRSLFVVEVNKKIINKDDYDNTYLNENDKVEIVSFVGGG